MRSAIILDDSCLGEDHHDRDGNHAESREVHDSSENDVRDFGSDFLHADIIAGP